MSSNPARTRPLERVASRRNVIRSAAWTTAAVTVVVATPNIAAASTPPPQGTADQVGVRRQGNNLIFNAGGLTAGSQPLTGVVAVVSLSFTPAVPVVQGSTTVGPWAAAGTTASSATFTLASLGAGATSAFRPIINLNNTEFVSVEVTVTYTWDGNPTGATTSTTFFKANSGI